MAAAEEAVLRSLLKVEEWLTLPLLIMVAIAEISPTALLITSV